MKQHSRSISLYSAYKVLADRAERRLAAENLSPGDVVVDAGADIGYTRVS